MSATIGVIGLGRTGLPIALNLIARGRAVIGYRRHDTGELAKAGGTFATSARDVAERSETIFTVLPSVAALDEVMAEILPVLGAGHVVTELGSHPLEVKQRYRDLCAAKGAIFLDGEISGTPAMTAARTAVILLAGDHGGAERIIAICRDACDHAVYAGELGAATKLKLIANHLVAVHTVAAAEAMLLVEAAGIDPGLAIDVIGLGAGSSTMWKARAPTMALRKFVDPAPGPVSMIHHYLTPIEALASGAKLPLFEIAAELYRSALENGRRDQDIGCVIELIAQKGRQT